MQKTLVTCDGCGEECNYHISINDAILKCANGRKLSVSLGYSHLTIKDQQFCSIYCLVDWFYQKMPNQDRGDYFFPGDQVGKMSARKTELTK